MELMDSMIAGGVLANGIVALNAGAALWLMMIVTLVGSGMGIVASAYRRRPFALSVKRRPNGSAAFAHPEPTLRGWERLT